MLGCRAHGGPSCSLHMSGSSPVRWVQGLEGLDMGVRTRAGDTHDFPPEKWGQLDPRDTPSPHHMAVEGLLPRDGGCVTTSYQGWTDHMTVSPTPAPPTSQKGKTEAQSRWGQAFPASLLEA